jgi:hypothetical protein
MSNKAEELQSKEQLVGNNVDNSATALQESILTKKIVENNGQGI